MGRGQRNQSARQSLRLAAQLTTRRQRDLESLGWPDDERLRLLEEQSDWLFSLVKQRGWPRQDEVGRVGALAAWLIAQHCPSLERQQYFYQQMNKQVSERQASAAHLAQLEDRILVRQGRKQRYGTQSIINDQGEAHLAPVDDPDNLSQRRQIVGLD